MSYCFEIKAERKIKVNPGSYFTTAILANGTVLPETKGRDEFTIPATLFPGKRVAGFGRQKAYAVSDLREVAPSSAFPLENTSDLAFRITTNVFLGQGLLASHLALSIAKDGGPAQDIPLCHPDVKIDWPSRGTFVVKVGPL